MCSNSLPAAQLFLWKMSLSKQEAPTVGTCDPTVGASCFERLFHGKTGLALLAALSRPCPRTSGFLTQSHLPRPRLTPTTSSGLQKADSEERVSPKHAKSAAAKVPSAEETNRIQPNARAAAGFALELRVTVGLRHVL